MDNEEENIEKYINSIRALQTCGITTIEAVENLRKANEAFVISVTESIKKDLNFFNGKNPIKRRGDK